MKHVKTARGTGGALSDVMENLTSRNALFYITTLPGYTLGLYNDFSPFNNKN